MVNQKETTKLVDSGLPMSYLGFCMGMGLPAVLTPRVSHRYTEGRHLPDHTHTRAHRTCSRYGYIPTYITCGVIRNP